MNSGRTFTRPIDLLGDQGGAEALGEQAVQRGPEEPAPKKPKSVMAQLALRASASAGQTQAPAGGFPGDMGPTRPLGGGKRKKKKKKKSGKKKKKKSKKSRQKAQGGGGPGGSSSGSSSSQSSSSESTASSGSENSGYLPPLKRKSDRRPGSVLELLIGQVEAQLSELQGAGMTGGSILAGTKMVSFYHLMIKSTVTPTSRDGRELFLLANLLDLLRQGELSRLGDAMSARFLALQQASLDQSWVAARHLEIFTPEVLTAAGAAVTLAARRHAKVVDRAKGLQQSRSRGEAHSSSAWGRSGAWAASGGDTPGEPYKGKGKKGKAKSKGGGGKTFSLWKGTGAWDSNRTNTHNKEESKEKEAAK